jgi:hypothetical protein
MIGLSIPQDFPLGNLIGQEVTQVCIGSARVTLRFYKPVPSMALVQQWEPGATIDIDAGFSLRLPDGNVQEVRDQLLGPSSGCLTALLGQTVSATERLSGNELLVQFSGDAELRLLIDPQGFGSYHIHLDDESVDVTKP